jgi:hypothetical protein
MEEVSSTFINGRQSWRKTEIRLRSSDSWWYVSLDFWLRSVYCCPIWPKNNFRL